MRRHREDISYPTCTVSTAPDPRVDIFSVTLSGAIAESKGLEPAEHAPVRFARALAISPSGPLDCARGDSLCCHVERRAAGPKSRHLDWTEHSPVRPTTALAISPSGPLDCARGDSLCCLVERRAAGPKSRHLDWAEHSPVRIKMALAISPSRPLDCARGDRTIHNAQFTMHDCSVSVMLSEGATSPEVETSRQRGTFTIATRTGSRSYDRRDPSIPLRSARDDSGSCHPERRGVNPVIETSRPIGAFTFTSHTRSSQTAKDETKVQSFARRGCGLPAQSADSTGENPRLRSG